VVGGARQAVATSCHRHRHAAGVPGTDGAARYVCCLEVIVSFPSSKPLAVVGVSGFVGSHVAALALDRGHPVHGTLRAPDGPASDWLRQRLGPRGELSLFAADVEDRDSLADAFAGCGSVVMSAGTEAQEPRTVELMTAAARNTLHAAAAQGIREVVFTSSTGSTNPPGGEPEVKVEAESWSDPEQQLAAGKFSPAAKTLMEQEALRLGDELDVRVVILNPSMIVGDTFGDEPSQVVQFLAQILAGARFADGAPDGSMSMIHVDDLAALHLAALAHPEARGRHFAVVRSWHWQDILEALQRAAPHYTAPPWPSDRPRARVTTFDTTKRDALGVELRGLDEMLADAVEALQRRGLAPSPEA